MRRGVRHNSYRLPDGTWTWRYDLFGARSEEAAKIEAAAVEAEGGHWVDFTSMWDEVDTISVPLMFVHGGLSPYVTDEDVAEFQRRLPSVRYEVVDGAGHAVQSDQPMRLVDLIQDFVFDTGSPAPAG